MFSKELENVIEAALADGVLTDKERAVLHRRAAEEGVDPDELDVVIDGRLAKMKREEDWLRPAPPSDKFGDVKRCPRCNEPVEPMAVKCSACGYEFRNVEALKSSQRLAEKLDAIDEDYRKRGIVVSNRVIGEGYVSPERVSEEKATVIKNFPVPTAKEDLLDFAISMQARAKNTKSTVILDAEANTMRTAYNAKYEECVNKARILFPNDPMFLGVFEQVKADKNIKNIWANMSIGKKVFLGWILAIIILLLFF